ncbi:MAG: DUF3047 domain-containing protein [Burkholderiales bacterium]
MTRHRWLSRISAAAACCLAAGALSQSDTLVVAAFSAQQPGAALPDAWKPTSVSSAKNTTRYTLVEDGGVTVVRAESSAAASGLSRNIKVNSTEFPILKWRWKISNILKASDIRSRNGDDYPARVYVMFDYPLEKLPFAERTKIRMARALHDPNLPTATLCYVWDSKAPVATIIPSSYTDRVRMVVVESGASRVNQWLAIERDVAADFKAAFGEDAPPITAVAIATDTDNTGESVVSHYGDISFNKHKVTK